MPETFAQPRLTRKCTVTTAYGAPRLTSVLDTGSTSNCSRWTTTVQLIRVVHSSVLPVAAETIPCSTYYGIDRHDRMDLHSTLQSRSTLSSCCIHFHVTAESRFNLAHACSLIKLRSHRSILRSTSLEQLLLTRSHLLDHATIACTQREKLFSTITVISC